MISMSGWNLWITSYLVWLNDPGTTQAAPAGVLQTSQRLSANTDRLISDGCMFDAGAGTHLSYHFADVRLSVLLLTRSQLPMLSFPLLVPPCTEQGAGWGPALTKGFVCKGWLTLNTTHTFSSVCDIQIWKYNSSPEIFRFDFPTWHPFQLVIKQLKNLAFLSWFRP